MVGTLTAVISAATLGTSGWALLELIGIKSKLAVLASQRDDHERRIAKLEERAGL